jgi:hypothetical protein
MKSFQVITSISKFEFYVSIIEIDLGLKTENILINILGMF